MRLLVAVAIWLMPIVAFAHDSPVSCGPGKVARIINDYVPACTTGMNYELICPREKDQACTYIYRPQCSGPKFRTICLTPEQETEAMGR